MRSGFIITSLWVTLSLASLAKAPYCLPHDDCFPSAEAIGHFNQSVHGALIRIYPYGQVCYKETYDAEACRSLADNKGDSIYRESLPGGFGFV